MSYDEHDAAWDAMYDKLSDELYPEHKAQAISEFTTDRLRSFYVEHPMVMRPAVKALQEGKLLQKEEHHAAAVVFFVSSVEMLFKSTLLRPVVYGLIHNEGLADVIVESLLNESGYSRYSKLLEKLFVELADIDIRTIKRNNAKETLLKECDSLQKLRNKIIHQGFGCSAEQSTLGLDVAVAVYNEIVNKMLYKLGLTVIEKGEIQPYKY